MCGSVYELVSMNVYVFLLACMCVSVRVFGVLGTDLQSLGSSNILVQNQALFVFMAQA